MNPMWHRVFELGIMTGHSCTVYLALINIKMIKIYLGFLKHLQVFDKYKQSPNIISKRKFKLMRSFVCTYQKYDSIKYT